METLCVEAASMVLLLLLRSSNRKLPAAINGRWEQASMHMITFDNLGRILAYFHNR